MSFLTDLRSVSDSAMEQLATRFPSLPRPLLAAIGAGDLAAEQLAELREILQSSVSGTRDVRGLAGDVPVRAQRAAGEVAASLGRFADQASARAQELIAQLPAKAGEIASSLSSETVRETVEAYTQLAAVIYGNLAQRGGRSWSRTTGQHSVIDGTAAPAASPDPEAEAAPASPRDALRARRQAAVRDATADQQPPPPTPRAADRTAAGRVPGAPEQTTGTARKPRAPRRTGPPPS